MAIDFFIIPEIFNEQWFTASGYSRLRCNNNLITSFFQWFFQLGSNYFDTVKRYQLYFVVIGIWIVQLIISPIWLKYYLFGPLEWVWRSLTYWKMQPMRRQKPGMELIKDIA